MGLDASAGDRDRLARKLLAVVLAVVTLRSLRRGQRLRAAVAGTGAVVLGFAGVAGTPDLDEAIDLEEGVPLDFGDSSGRAVAREDGQLRCSICGDPIVPGERRGPDPNDDIAHVDCLERLQER